MSTAIASHSSLIRAGIIACVSVAVVLACASTARADSNSSSHSHSNGAGYSSAQSKASELRTKAHTKRLESAKKRLAMLEGRQEKSEATTKAIERLKATTIPDLEKKIAGTSSQAGSESSSRGNGLNFGDRGNNSRGDGGARTEALQKRIAQLEEMQARLKSLIENRGGAASSTKPMEKRSERKERADRDRCRAGANASSSSSNARCIDAQASSTIKVLYPNNQNKVVRNKKDSAILVMWRHRGVDTVDIDLKKTGSSTVSVAKNVPARSLMGSAIGGFTQANDPSKILKGKQGVGRYLYKSAPLGDGYTIVITGKKTGGGTISDESNKEFSIVDARSAADWNKKMKQESKTAADDEDEDEDGSVLGASTSSADEYIAVLDGLDEVLAGFAAELTQ